MLNKCTLESHDPILYMNKNITANISSVFITTRVLKQNSQILNDFNIYTSFISTTFKNPSYPMVTRRFSDYFFSKLQSVILDL